MNLYNEKTGSFLNRYLLIISILFSSVCLTSSCSDDDDDFPKLPNTCLSDDEIVIENIINIPEGVTFNKLKAEITGNDWGIIDVVETTYSEGKAVLSLPTSFSRGELQKVVRDSISDYAGHWYAITDNADARVAELGDLVAYYNDKRVGMISLTDWTGEGAIIKKSTIYYHYTDQDYTLTTCSKMDSYQYKEASFKKGWNAYANINLSEESGAGAIVRTTAINKDTSYVWRFVAQ